MQKGSASNALGFYFTHSGFTPEKYDEAISQLNAAGAGSPAGRSYQVVLESDRAIQVFDIWESQAAVEAFGPTLMRLRPRRRHRRTDGGGGAQRDPGLKAAALS